MLKKIGLLYFLILFIPGFVLADFSPVQLTDSSKQKIFFTKPPQRIVSLVPSVTEMLLRLGVEEQVKGITYHSVLSPESAGKEIIGGFFQPDLDKVATLQPDLIFYAGVQKGVTEKFSGQVQLVQIAPQSIKESFDYIRQLGRLFHKNEEAERLIAEEERQLKVIAEKVAKIAPEKKLRVMRLMGREEIKTPGDDSFQNEYILAAGGIAPGFGKNGSIVPVSLEEWQEFNPQVLYGCGGDRETLTILEQPGWKDVEAVKNNKIFFFPCDLTCRAATHSGYFVSWLAAGIYADEFSDPAQLVLPQKVVERKSLSLDLDYVEKAEIISSDIKDFRNKTVVVTFDRPMKVVSTLEGQRDEIQTVANHYFPPPSWGLDHNQGVEVLRNSTLGILGFDPQSTSILFTGADMDNLAVVKKSFRDMEVTALVTAGVMGNSVRMSKDIGTYYEPEGQDNTKPGTINILLFTNMKLSARAMTRAMVSATEGKSAVLQDMDIRSSYSGLLHQATGTGTDNVTVVQGAGIPIDSSGGHSKMGELISRAVYQGVQEAVYLQNGLIVKRPVFRRLKERKIRLSQICRDAVGAEQGKELQREVEHLLLQPRYGDFLTAIMAVSDDYEQGLVQDTGSIDSWAIAIATEIGGPGTEIDTSFRQDPPRVLGKGIGAMIAGGRERVKRSIQE